MSKVVQHLKATAVRVLSKSGYTVFRSDPSGEVVQPLATYAPWKADAEFQTIYALARNSTLVDVYRLWELWLLVEQSRKVPGAILEVGVWRGGSTAIMARRAVLSGISDPIFACDTFTGVVKAGVHDPDYQGGEHSDTSLEGVRSFLEKTARLTNVQLVRGIFPDEGAAKITAEKLRLCHVDVDTYDSARQIAEWAWPRLSVGGIMVFDDYGFVSTPGVTKYVNEARSEPDRVFLHNLNGHGVFIKTK